jgi:diguanylate cyclase (GGDEF)-like protein
MTWGEPGGKGRVLIVDDAIENIRILNSMLKDEHEVVFALDGRKALDIARDQAPDIILLDAVMPDLDGYAVCAELKAAPTTRDIPVLFVTALNTTEDETRALDAGAIDFITKPVSAAVVRARVRTHLTLKRQSDMLRQLAMTDGLTGVANRRNFDEALEKEWRRCERARQPVSLIMADVDHFKAYNDNYGHQAGDSCLAAVAAAMGGCVRRPPDMVARYGGEEFVVLLPQEDADGAAAVAERILDRVRGLGIDHAHSSCAKHVTVSLGVATMMPARDRFPAGLVAAADSALYRAKETGRNRHVRDNG